jgi:hypothetical protein
MDGTTEQSLDLLGRSEIAGLSADGRSVLLNETREVGRGAYLRSTDGARTIPLTPDRALGLSPDGAWALVQRGGSLSRLVLVPTGAGVERDVVLPQGFESSGPAISKWSPDGRRLFMWLRPAGSNATASRLHVRENDGSWRAITPALPVDVFAVSPDGQAVATRDETGLVAIFPRVGEAPRRLDGERRRVIHWSVDGHLFLRGDEFFPARIHRRDLQSGRVDPLRTITPADVTGVMFIGAVLVSSDDRSFVYQYSRGLQDLYLARDLR